MKNYGSHICFGNVCPVTVLHQEWKSVAFLPLPRIPPRQGFVCGAGKVLLSCHSVLWLCGVGWARESVLIVMDLILTGSGAVRSYAKGEGRGSWPLRMRP